MTEAGAFWTWLELAEERARLLTSSPNLNRRHPGPDCCRAATAKLEQQLLQESCNTLEQRWKEPTGLPQGSSAPLDVVSQNGFDLISSVVTSCGAIPVRPASWVMRAS